MFFLAPLLKFLAPLVKVDFCTATQTHILINLGNLCPINNVHFPSLLINMFPQTSCVESTSLLEKVLLNIRQ